MLTDDWVTPETSAELESLFADHDCRLLDISREPERKRPDDGGEHIQRAETLSLDEYFVQFYRNQTGKDDPSPDELSLIRFAAEQIGAGLEKDEDELADALVSFAMKQEGKAE